MDFGDKVAGAELPAESRASGRHRTFDSTKSPDWAYDEGAPGRGELFVFSRYFEPGGRLIISVVFSFSERPIRLFNKENPYELQGQL